MKYTKVIPNNCDNEPVGSVCITVLEKALPC